MQKTFGFKITVEYDCHDMILENDFLKSFDNDPMRAYKFISDDFTDDPSSFADGHRIVKIELIDEPQP